jgi:hypothetical protein
MIQEKSANKILFDTILNYEHEMKWIKLNAKSYPKLVLNKHYINMHPNSLCSLDFEWIWTHLPQQEWSISKEQGLIAMDSWINSPITNETRLLWSEINSLNHSTWQ